MTPGNPTDQPLDVSYHDLTEALTHHASNPAVPTHIHTTRDWAEVTHRAMDGAGTVWRGVWKLIKLGICMGMDILDFFIGRILGFGIVFDVGCALIAVALWGNRGWWALWEVVDVTEQIDSFVPTCTIIAIRAWNDY